MEYNELTSEERLLLVVLLELVIKADQAYSDQEDSELKRIAAMIGEAQFKAAIQEADRRFSSGDDLRQLAQTIQRPEARELILATIQELAVVDEVSIEEMQLVNWLADLWDL